MMLLKLEQQRKAGLGREYMSWFEGASDMVVSTEHVLPLCGSMSSTP
jgi:hypothetical protein